MTPFRSGTEVPEPSRPTKLTVDFRETTDAMAITARPGGGPGAFLVLWQIGWTVGCVFLIGQVINEPEPGMILFAIPFCAAWLAVACFLIWAFFGSETLLVRTDRVLFLRKAFVTLNAREIPIEEVQGFQSCRSKYQENECYLWGIEVQTLGKPIRFGFRTPARERDWLIYQLNRFADCNANAAEADHVADFDRQQSSSPRRSSERLTTQDVLDDPPTDCSWKQREFVDGVELVQRGRFRIGVFFGLLFINAFWNGIVSVFVLALFGLMPVENGAPQGAEWWGMLVFLIPFEVIGLAMLVGLLGAMVEPFRQTHWRLEHHELIKQIRWPLFRLTWRWPTDSVEHLEQRRGEEEESGKANLKAMPKFTDDGAFELAFVSTSNTDLCSISGLTEGEARWMAGVVFRYRPQWS